MEHPDAQHPTPSTEAPVPPHATASTGRANGRYRGPISGPRRPNFRTYGVPVRERRQRAYAAQHAARAPGASVSAPRRMLVTAFINRNFALLWWGQTVSSVGDFAWDTALILWIATDIARKPVLGATGGERGDPGGGDPADRSWPGRGRLRGPLG